MSKGEIESLEREVVDARSRLTADLARLSSAEVFGGFKRGVSRDFDHLKQQAMETTKEAARDGAQNLLEMVTDRIAANPAAAAAIGAGLAWRLFRHPPISTALVGLGIYGLVRSNGNGLAAAQRVRRNTALVSGNGRQGIDWRGKAEVFAENARGQLADAADVVSGHVSDAAGVVSHKVGGAAAAASATIGEATVAARETIGEATVAARESIGSAAQAAATRLGDMATDATDKVRRSMSQAGEATAAWAESGRRKVSRIVEGPEPRDAVLLGAAAVAIVTAIGLAARRPD